jgi:BA14K-like protein
MNDIQTHLDKIRSDAAECVLLSNLVADGKGEVFARTAKHLSGLALEIEKTVATNSADKGTRGESVNMARAGGREEAVAVDIAAAPRQQVVRPRRTLPWLLVVVLGGIVGAFVWWDNPAKDYWFLYTLQSKHETSPAAEDQTKQAIATLLSGVQAERKILTEQLSALAARVDNLATALDNLKTARAEIAGPSKSVGAEEKPPVAETKPSAPEEKPVRRDENPTSALESPAAAKQSNGVPPATNSPLIEPVDRVGAIQVPQRPVELDPRKSTIGPSGCTQFRSFDPVSGTYTTLDGRRRECRQ